MKYAGMPQGMWILFGRSFRQSLIDVLGYDDRQASKMTSRAKERYRQIIEDLPEFEKKDRFKMNIVSCAMYGAFCLQIDREMTEEDYIEFYRKAMMTEPMILFCRMAGRSKYTKKDIEGMKFTVSFRAADRNPYSWNMEYIPYIDDKGYEARFTHCGICVLLKELGLEEAVPGMCKLDYTMAEAGGVTDFVREYTLAKGGPYCDCGYRRKK